MLKILKGNPPPVSNVYSAELRNLIQSLLKKTPVDRPSLNTILRKGIYILGLLSFNFNMLPLSG